MANVFLLTTIAIVVSPSVNCERRAFLPNANNFLKAVPNHWKHDKEELNKNLVKNAGQPWEEMRVGPRPPPLHSNPPAQWILAQQNQLPVLPDKGQTLRRIEQLQNKLNNQPRSNIIQTLNHPHPKPEIEVKLHKNKRQKREAKLLQNGFRHKREVVINPQMQPELIMQSHIQPALLQKIDAKNVGHSRNFLFYNPNIYYPDIIGSLNNKSDHEQEKDAEKRDKRQILLMIKQQPLNLGKKPRTTPNPFIRDTNIADYEIGKVDIDKPEINVVDTMDTDSYQLNEEASEFSNILSNFYLTASPEHWPKIEQFAVKVLKPLSELLDSGNYFNHRPVLETNDRFDMATEQLVTNRRVKRKLDKTLIRKRAKKRKQKLRRVERKRLRMLTHARRLRKQRKSKLARLERHYARMNLTTTMQPNLQAEHTNSEGKVNKAVKQGQDLVVISKGEGSEEEDDESDSDYDTESDSEYYNTESDSDDEYDTREESESGVDKGNDDEYEDYDGEGSSSNHEYVDYENVVDESNKAKETNIKKESNKKPTEKKETSKKKNNKTGKNKQK